MPKGLKYKYFFKSFSNDDCEVRFSFEGYTGNFAVLNPGIKPFILKEYNSSNDIFKPIRPFQAEMEILSDLVSIDDFVLEGDDSILVEFLFNGSTFWSGWLIQDDFDEVWIDTNHFITLRATDGLGEIGSQNLPNMIGLFPMLDYLSYAVENTALGTGFGNRTFVNNLFYEGMFDRDDGVYTPLTQTYLDAKTFDGDNKLTVLEKINKGWSMTVYQWANKWFFGRIEEWFTNLPIKGINFGLLGNTAFTKTYEVLVGIGEAIKPIMPEMLKTIRRGFKNTKITFFYQFPPTLVLNQNFLSGTLRIPTPNTYTIDNWGFYSDKLDRTIAGTSAVYRVQETDINGNVIDSYMEILRANKLQYAASSPIYINYNDTIEVSFDVRYKNFNTTASYQMGYIVLEGNDNNKYILRGDGRWFNTNNYTTNIFAFSTTWSNTGEDVSSKWKSFSVTSAPTPVSGIAYIYLSNNANGTTFPFEMNHKNLSITITENNRLKGVIGDYDQYTLSSNIIQNFEEQTYLDDTSNIQQKGALAFNNQVTGDRWYRMDFPAERLTFKRHKAIAHMEMNRRSRALLQVNMLGNTWNDNGVKRPIWLQNKLIFIDDAPTKKWMIVNLSEMDFSTTQWKAQLIEVWDSEIDNNNPALYPNHNYDNIYER
jgi:hypothetical protein